MRFNSKESPSHINHGEGWDVDAARQWLAKHGLKNDDYARDGEMLRFRQFKGGRFSDVEDVTDGVTLILYATS